MDELIVIRALLYASVLLLFGLPAFAMLALPRDRAAMRLRLPLGVTAAVGLVATLVGLVLLAAAMTGAGIGAVDADTIGLILGETAVGMAIMIRAAALAAACIAALLIPRLLPWTALVCGSVAAATLAWGGHGVMNDGTIGWLHLGADILHLLAAGLWLGGLFGLIGLVADPVAARDPQRIAVARRALERFSGVGTAIVAVLLVTGIVNGWMILGSDVAAAIGRDYGRLLILKLVAFAGMLVLAATNRMILVPMLAQDDTPARSLRLLRVSIGTETALIMLIFALVAWLGTIEP